MRLLIIEDGDEYVEFARVFLRDWELESAASGAQALERLQERFDALLIDLRFERAQPGTLLGDLDGTAERLFAGNRGRALRHLQDQQGTLILAALREAGHHQPALFVHPFPQRRLDNLRKLYGAVDAVPGFDAAAIHAALTEEAGMNREGRSRLLHDVGKYVGRTARNLPDGPLDRDLIEMLMRDLYQLKPGRRASAVFDELAEPDPRLEEIRQFFAAIDKLEPRVRELDEAAVRGAAALALEVERRLRDFAGDAA